MKIEAEVIRGAIQVLPRSKSSGALNSPRVAPLRLSRPRSARGAWQAPQARKAHPLRAALRGVMAFKAAVRASSAPRTPKAQVVPLLLQPAEAHVDAIGGDRDPYEISEHGWAVFMLYGLR